MVEGIYSCCPFPGYTTPRTDSGSSKFYKSFPELLFLNKNKFLWVIEVYRVKYPEARRFQIPLTEGDDSLIIPEMVDLKRISAEHPRFMSGTSTPPYDKQLYVAYAPDEPKEGFFDINFSPKGKVVEIGGIVFSECIPSKVELKLRVATIENKDEKDRIREFLGEVKPRFDVQFLSVENLDEILSLK